MFDIERALDAWRQRMVAAGIKAPAVLEELEGHLREEVYRQTEEGVGAQTAFERAVTQIGDGHDLQAEFAKVAPVGLPRRYLCLFCFLAAPLLVFVNLWTLQPREIEMSWWTRFVGLATMAVAALYIGGLPFLHPRLPSPGHWLVRGIMALGCLLAMVWPLFAASLSIGMVPLQVEIGLEMAIWSVGAAWFATWLAYGVDGEIVCSEPAAIRRTRT